MRENTISQLTLFEMSVCHEFFKNGLNKSEAYRKCHRAATGWAESTVWNRASEFFQKPHIQRYVNELHEQARAVALKKFDITAEKVLQEFAKIAFFDIRAIFSENGNLINPPALSDDMAAALASIEVVTKTIGSGEDMEIEYTHKIKPYDKLRALENLARYLHLFELNGKEGEQDDACFKGIKVPPWMKEMIPSAGD